MSETQQPEQAQPVEEAVALTKETALKKALSIALTRGYVVKGISETVKALEAGKVQMVFLAEDCDNEEYKQLVKAFTKQCNVKLISIESWENLKDYCQLGLLSATIRKVAEDKGKEAKIKPRCSCCAILDWGDESDAKQFLIDFKPEE